MLCAVFAALVAFADPVTAVNQPSVTIENWDGEDLTVYTNEPLIFKPVDPAKSQLLWIPTADTLAPKAVRLANNMLVFSQASVGVIENLQLSVANGFLVGFAADLKYRVLQFERLSAAVQAGGGFVAFNGSALGFGRAIVTYATEELSFTAAGGGASGTVHRLADYRDVMPGNFWAGSLGGTARMTDYAVFLVETTYGEGLERPYGGRAWIPFGGVRLHGKQVAFDAGFAAMHVRKALHPGEGMIPWVGLSWLDP